MVTNGSTDLSKWKLFGYSCLQQLLLPSAISEEAATETVVMVHCIQGEPMSKDSISY